MRIGIAILLLFIYSGLFAQKADTISLKKAIVNLNIALLQKDSVMLNNLLSNKLSYGHSNGWIETKRDVIDDLYNGKLVYNKIEQTAPQIIIEDKTVAVRVTADVDILFGGKEVTLKLQILQVWIWKNKEWILLSRQSVKM